MGAGLNLHVPAAEAAATQQHNTPHANKQPACERQHQQQVQRSESPLPAALSQAMAECRTNSKLKQTHCGPSSQTNQGLRATQTSPGSTLTPAPAQRQHQAERQQAALPAAQLRQGLLPHPAKGDTHFQAVQERAALWGVEARRRVGQQRAEDRVEVAVNLCTSHSMKTLRYFSRVQRAADHSTAEHSAPTETRHAGSTLSACSCAAGRRFAHAHTADTPMRAAATHPGRGGSTLNTASVCPLTHVLPCLLKCDALLLIKLLDDGSDLCLVILHLTGGAAGTTHSTASSLSMSFSRASRRPQLELLSATALARH